MYDVLHATEKEAATMSSPSYSPHCYRLIYIRIYIFSNYCSLGLMAAHIRRKIFVVVLLKKKVPHPLAATPFLIT